MNFTDTIEMLRSLAVCEAQRSVTATNNAMDDEDQLNLMTAGSAQQNAAVYHVGAAICERLDYLITMFEASLPQN